MNLQNIPLRPAGQQAVSTTHPPPEHHVADLPSQSASTQQRSPGPPTTTQDLSDDKQQELLSKMLSTRFEDVFAVSGDGEFYTGPWTLKGTMTGNLTENHEYWDRNWASLDDFLAKEKDEEEKKAEAHRLLAADPQNPRWKAAYKLHSDNVSKHRKIREVFGSDTPRHPNQLVSKRHLPPHGLCFKEIMYRLACKYSDLLVLRNNGQLAMDPWDFLRWRISKKATSLMKGTWDSANENLKTIIYKICEAPSKDDSRDYSDPLLRMAILRSAQISGSINSYRTVKGKNGAAASKPGPARTLAKKVRTNPLGPRPARVKGTPAAVVAERREKRLRQARIPEYQGVNAFRAQQRQREAQRQQEHK